VCDEKSRRFLTPLEMTEEFRMSKNYYVYIMTNKSRTFYTGLTNNLERRVYEHKHKLIEGFTKRYNITQLVYYEVFDDVRSAIVREKQVKDWRREKKIALIESMNPTWKDLSAEWEDFSLRSK
jgi:putative endonuclease